LDALAVIVNKSNPVNNLSTDELRENPAGEARVLERLAKDSGSAAEWREPGARSRAAMVDMNDSTYKQYTGANYA
jgi:ABC-type phosphate transport system substrate-binding protein